MLAEFTAAFLSMFLFPTLAMLWLPEINISSEALICPLIFVSRSASGGIQPVTSPRSELKLGENWAGESTVRLTFATFKRRFRILKGLTLLSDGERAYKSEKFEVAMLAILNRCCLGVPAVVQRKQIQLGTMRLGIWSLASLRGLTIQRCCELWCRLQTRLWSRIAVALA